MSEQETSSPFETIRHTTDEGAEYWSARELARCSIMSNGATLPRLLRKRALPARTVDKPSQTILLASAIWSRLALAPSAM